MRHLEKPLLAGILCRFRLFPPPAKLEEMCAKQSLQQPVSAANRWEATLLSLTPANTFGSGYLVLRDGRRRPSRSVDRNDAGRNAKPKGSSVKGSSPDKQYVPKWPSDYRETKATPEWKPALTAMSFPPSPHGTSGVQDRGMY